MPDTLTQERALSLFEYREGVLYWKVDKGTAYAGTPAGRYSPSNKYYSTKIDGKYHMNHRIIFLMHYGYLPKMIDHINEDKCDNRIENLRECTPSQNKYNTKLSVKNKSGYKGVCKHKSGKWEVKVRADKKLHHLGYYDDLELAALVAEEGRNKYHKEFANHG